MKPLVTLILLTYNQKDFVEDAVKSVIKQDYENLEVIISDDGSVDQTFKIISDTIKLTCSGKNIILNRNEKNLGLTAHFNKVLQMANGEIIVVAAGDDISLPNRVARSVEILLEHQDVSFVSFNEEQIDSKGNTISIGKRVKSNRLQKFDLYDYVNGVAIPFSGASRAFRRELYDCFGDLMSTCPTEDTPYLLRGLILGKGAVSPDIGIRYRRHNNNLSNATSLALMDINAITNQYKSDIHVAVSKHKIAQSDASKVLSWAKRNQTKREKLNQLHLSNSKLAYFLRNIVFENSISPLNRIKLLKNIVLKKST